MFRGAHLLSLALMGAAIVAQLIAATLIVGRSLVDETPYPLIVVLATAALIAAMAVGLRGRPLAASLLLLLLGIASAVLFRGPAGLATEIPGYGAPVEAYLIGLILTAAAGVWGLVLVLAKARLWPFSGQAEPLGVVLATLSVTALAALLFLPDWFGTPFDDFDQNLIMYMETAMAVALIAVARCGFAPFGSPGWRALLRTSGMLLALLAVVLFLQAETRTGQTYALLALLGVTAALAPAAVPRQSVERGPVAAAPWTAVPLLVGFLPVAWAAVAYAFLITNGLDILDSAPREQANWATVAGFLFGGALAATCAFLATVARVLTRGPLSLPLLALWLTPAIAAWFYAVAAYGYLARGPGAVVFTVSAVGLVLTVALLSPSAVARLRAARRAADGP